MQSSYTVRQEADLTWTVLLEATGMPIRLAGILQTGLTQIEAELTLEILGPKLNRSPHQELGSNIVFPPYRAVA